MRLLLDEMHAPGIADRLSAESFDVIAVAAQPGLRGTPDADLLALAAAEGRALVTENVADFMALASHWASTGASHAGLIFTHPRTFDRASRAYPQNLARALRQFLVDPPVTGSSWIWWL